MEAIAALRTAGRRVGFVTNDGRPSEEDLVRKLWGLGVQASREEVVTVGGALQYALVEAQRSTAFVIGSPSMHRHVADAGLRILNGSDLADRAEVVVIAEHDGFDYFELQAAVRGRACAARSCGAPGATPTSPTRAASARARARSSPPSSTPRAPPHGRSASPTRRSSSPRWTASAASAR